MSFVSTHISSPPLDIFTKEVSGAKLNHRAHLLSDRGWGCYPHQTAQDKAPLVWSVCRELCKVEREADGFLEDGPRKVLRTHLHAKPSVYAIRGFLAGQTKCMNGVGLSIQRWWK